ncbi:hypothetical protein DAEQUDRAFT_384243 [Daedalea quercina L-15889]|uniref:Uncharacterized protein n=1 Tax=Daedalea quercina L-15889 TaxID=1314783 RepID=A0A165P162_9APHY|nr:hypothetical protein DAEQUDRAFT_384243 [Daedalea quercina L-15889]
MMILRLLFLVSACSVYVSAWFFTNVTVDDTYGNEATSAQVSYDGLWSDVQNCTESGETVCPSPERAYNHTWHAAAEYGTAQISFSGTALYVYCILAQNHTTDLTFWLDNNLVDTFNQSANDSTAIQYDVLVIIRWGFSTISRTPLMQSLWILRNRMAWIARQRPSLLLSQWWAS